MSSETLTVKNSLIGKGNMEIRAIGGYNEFGRNMTEISVRGDSIIIDMGIKLDMLTINEDTEIEKLPHEEISKLGIIPDVSRIKGKVKAIVISHGHLDHMGAVKILAGKFKDVPIYARPFTAELIMRDGVDKSTKRRVKKVQAGEIVEVSDKISIEFIHATHSILESSFVAVHTKEGSLVYANDFKFDDTPVIGEKTDYKRLKQLGKEGVKALIVESTRVNEERKTPSEKIARELIMETLTKADNDKALIATTFASHQQRIKSLIDLALKINRKPIIIGRSMTKYNSLAKELKLLDFPKEVELYRASKSVARRLKEIQEEGKENYLIITTGHQGEADSVLSRIANNVFPFRIEKGDQIAFCADVIPNPLNIASRYILETKLKLKKARIIKGLHVSGHAFAEDHRYLLKLLNPEYIIPCHGDMSMLTSYAMLAEFLGYSVNRDIFILRNSQEVEI